MNPTKTYRIATWLLWLMTLVCGNLYAGSLQTAVPVVEQEQISVLTEDVFDIVDQRSAIFQESSFNHSQKLAYAAEVSVAEYGEKVADIALSILTAVSLGEYQELADSSADINRRIHTGTKTPIDATISVIETIAGIKALSAISVTSIKTSLKTGAKNIKKAGSKLANRLKTGEFSKLATKLDDLEKTVPGSRGKFLEDFAEASDDVINKVGENPQWVESWKSIKYCGDNDLARLATNLDELNLVSQNIGDIKRFGNYVEWNRILRGVVKNSDELLYRLSKTQPPKGEIYKGDFYRTVDNSLDPLHTHPIPRSKRHRYSKEGEDALYFSSSKEGNIQELTYWGKEIEGETTTFIYKNIESKNLLDLSNPNIRKELGIDLQDITGDSYEISNTLGSWAKNKYDGIIAPSARGTSDNKYFINIVIFKSNTANSLIKGKEIIKIIN